MNGGRLLRIGLVGATGTVGGELLELLESRRFPLQELVPVASERSLGETVEWLGHSLPVETELPGLAGLDLLFLCVPRDAALPWLERAVEAGVPCIDLSGAVADRPEVPLLAADLEATPQALQAPVVSCPSAAALALSLVLAPLAAAAGLRRAVVTMLLPAAAAGRRGIAALEAETVALFNQQEWEEGSVFPHAIAFDCVPSPPEASRHRVAGSEAELAGEVGRLLGRELPLAVSAVQVPIFSGLGLVLALETERPLAPEACEDLLAKAPGVAVWTAEVGPGTRASAGQSEVFVGRVRPDPSASPRTGGLLLWLSVDPVRLAATNALRLAAAHFAAGV